MRVSVVTPVLNCARTIEDCILSVLGQSHPDIEHVLIDGGSVDGTVETILKYQDRLAYWASKPDAGLYHAINEGIGIARGDVVGVLGADDLYDDGRVIETVVSAFEKSGADSVYGDLLYVHPRNPDRVIRCWISSPCRPGCFHRGWMPPHPTFFVKRGIYEEHGLFNTDFRLAADYELMLRLLMKRGISTHYVPRVLVRMRLGGVSNRGFRNLFRKSYEDYRAWEANGLEASVLTIMMKVGRKLPQFFRRPG